MQARILEKRDTRQYVALCAHAASECPAYAPRDPGADLFLLADRATSDALLPARQGTVVWGAYDGHLLAGKLAISRRFNVHIRNHLWLWGLYVRPRYRGTPASRLLMDAMLAWCKGEPADERLVATYRTSNRRAEQFLSRWGFQVIPMFPDFRAVSGIEAGSVLVERERD